MKLDHGRCNKMRVVALVTLCACIASKGSAFAPITHQNSVHPPKYVVLKRAIDGGSALHMSGLEDLFFSAQSSASSLADISMNSLGSSSSASSGSSILILYLAGLLTSFSPCSLGLLPLTISYISTAAGERSDKAAFFPTVAFAAGLASVFCGLGLSVSLIGGVFGQTMSNNNDAQLYLVALSAIVTIAMGLQLLELIRIPIPTIQSKDLPVQVKPQTSSSPLFYDEMNDNSNDNNDGVGDTGALFRTFLLGGSSALLASPCATPVLTSILAFVGASQNPVLGATLLLTYTAGYSTPLLLVAATGGEALAKARAAATTSMEGGADASIFPSTILPKLGQLITPLTGALLVSYGTNSMLTTFFGDPSLSGLSPPL